MPRDERASPPVAPAPAGRPYRPSLADQLYDRRMDVLDLAQEAIEAEIPDEDEVERLVEEVGERLEDREVYGDILDRPIGAIFARLCRDLGLNPDWSLWAQEDWAVEEAQAAAEGSPLGAGPRTDDFSPFEPPLAVQSTGPP